MKAVIYAAAVAALMCGRAAAFHPLVGEDTAFLGRDVRQIEAGLAYTVSGESQAVYTTGASAELSYGLFSRLDVMVTVPWQGWSSHGLSESGLGDARLELKFPVGVRAGWTLALKPGFSLPAGDEARSLGAGKGGVWLYGLAGRTDGPRRYYLNAGYLYNRNSRSEEEDIFKASAAAALEFLPEAAVTAMLTLETNPERGAVSHPVSSVLGLVWSPSPALDLNAGVKLGLNTSADDLGLLAGLTIRL